MKKPLNIKKFLLPNIPYVFIALYATKLGQAARLPRLQGRNESTNENLKGEAGIGAASQLSLRLLLYPRDFNTTNTQ